MELYNQRQVEKFAVRIRKWLIVATVLAVLTLICCIVCCCSITTATAAQWETRAILISTVGGWLVIFIVTMRINPDRYAMQHEQNILSGERTCHSGVITLEPQVLQIPKSITICKVVLGQGADARRFSIRGDKVRLLKPYDGKNLTFYTVKGYIAAWEELS